MSPDWSDKEVVLIVEDYFAMLRSELEGIRFSKKEHRTRLLPSLNNRTNGSVEFKYQNISAVLAKLGQYHIKGYKPRSNYQELLVNQVIKSLRRYGAELEPLLEKFAEEAVWAVPLSQNDFADSLEEKPPKSTPKIREAIFRAVKTSYLEKEQRNKVLGVEGEQFVLEYEKWRLTKSGRKDLVSKIKWVSDEKGDGAGYDILSKNVDGTDRFIEVKTTKLSKEAPIYFSFNEFMFAQKHATQFYLYRVFNFGSDTKLFILQGSYGDHCELMPMTYKGIF